MNWVSNAPGRAGKHDFSPSGATRKEAKACIASQLHTLYQGDIKREQGSL